jgi:hypothetical protein
LLVVISIIAILAAILFPVFSQAREKARQISCLSGVRQVGLGLAMYVQDYDELMPRIWYGPSSALQMYFWMDALLPYIKTANFFSACPSKNFGNWTPSNYIPPATYARTNVAFAANALYSQVQDAIDGQSMTPPFRESNVALTQIVIPASTIALGDGSGYYIAYSAHKLQTKVELDPPSPLAGLTPTSDGRRIRLGSSVGILRGRIGRSAMGTPNGWRCAMSPAPTETVSFSCLPTKTTKTGKVREDEGCK